MRDLLFEIGTEELPAGFINPAVDQLLKMFQKKSKKLALGYSEMRGYGTPRRLAIVVNELEASQKDMVEVLLGPSKKAGFDEQGNPTPAAQGFARSKGATVDDLELVVTEKGEYLQLKREVKGQPTIELLPLLLKEMIGELAFPKSMRWGSNMQTFARPIQWLTVRYGDQTVDLEHEGIVSSNKTQGHRFLAPEPRAIDSVKMYEQTLTDAEVIGDYEQRKEAVLASINEALKTGGFGDSGSVFIDDNLLATVTNLIEKPFGICGTFDEKFLGLPDEVLITSMREHQKYFPIIDQNKKLLPGFIAVNNTRVKNDSLSREGHERVLRARLEDALFFFESDKKQPLDNRIAGLTGIIFQAKLGTMREKSERIIKLTRLLAESLEPEWMADAQRAAQLCKADLITDMVAEFPSLQGTMGAAYAQEAGEADSVVQGIKEHYMPLRAGAPLPGSVTGTLVGMADRIDTIAGCFGIGQVPTGTTDPFGLRRLALALIHLISDRSYQLDLNDIFKKALALYGDKVNGGQETVESIVEFIRRRFENDLVAKGGDNNVIQAVSSVDFSDVIDCTQKINALAEFQGVEDFAILASSFKRVRNIVKDNSQQTIDAKLLSENAEKQLYQVYEKLVIDLKAPLEKKNYQEVLKKMLVLKDPVDIFFDEVMVMAEDRGVRQNRLNMLTAIGSIILSVGDISKMHRE